jgi:large subunit ribosomal protein L15
MPLHRRMPKRGFTNIFKKQFALVNLERLETLDGDTFTPERLLEMGVIRRMLDGVKILGEGTLTRPITVSAHRFSKSAAEKIAAAGGKAEVLAK